MDANNGWIVGDEVPIMYTPDGGLSWYEQSTSEGVYYRLYAVDFVDQTHGWAVGSGGYILRTTRGNSTDMRLWTGMNDPIFLSIIGGLTGVAVVVVITLWIIRSRIGSKQRSQQGLDL